MQRSAMKRIRVSFDCLNPLEFNPEHFKKKCRVPTVTTFAQHIHILSRKNQEEESFFCRAEQRNDVQNERKNGNEK